MEDNLKRVIYYYETEPDRAVLEAFRDSIAFCISAQAKNLIFLALTLGNLHGVVSTALSDKFIDALKSKKIIPVNGINVKLVTEKSLTHLGKDDIVLALHPTARLLDTIDGYKNIQGVFVVLWNEEDVAYWKRTWNPEEEGDKIKMQARTALPEEVIAKLSLLTDMVNLSTGLGHPLDFNRALDLFIELHDQGIAYNPDDIKVWAMQNGWTPDGANDLIELSGKILSGTKVRRK